MSSLFQAIAWTFADIVPNNPLEITCNHLWTKTQFCQENAFENIIWEMLGNTLATLNIFTAIL